MGVTARAVERGGLGGSDRVVAEGCWVLITERWCEWWPGGVWKGLEGNGSVALWWVGTRVWAMFLRLVGVMDRFERGVWGVTVIDSGGIGLGWV